MQKCIYWQIIFLNIVAITSIIANSTTHIIGDSHAHFSFRNDETPRYFNKDGIAHYQYKHQNRIIAVHWIKGKTMYRIGASGLQALNITHYGIQENDVVVFIFGEIDARCHIGKQRDQKNRNLDDIIESLVANYMQTINQNRRLYHTITCVVMEVMPPTNQCYNPEVPFYGSLEDRIIITKKLNESLKIACEQYDILFLPTHNLYANEDGSLNTALSDTFVHIGFTYNYLLKDQLFLLLNHYDNSTKETP